MADDKDKDIRKAPGRDLEERDYLALAVAMLETILLPVIVLVIVLVLFVLVFGTKAT
jgi:hypothetical protein